MNGPIKFDAMIIDPDLDTRMRLKQATTVLHQFGKVHQQSTLRDSISRLGTEIVDVCFISYRIEKDEVAGFIRDAKNTKGGQDTAYVLVLKSKDQDASVVATNVIAGFDGFLFEPYSVEQLIELTHLAARVRKERMSAREEAALRFLINDMINQIDQIAYLKSAGYDMGASMRKFKDLCSVLNTLQPESLAIYSKLALDLFESAPLPKKIFQRKIYGGASSRVKKRQEKAILDQIASESTPKPS